MTMGIPAAGWVRMSHRLHFAIQLPFLLPTQGHRDLHRHCPPHHGATPCPICCCHITVQWPPQPAPPGAPSSHPLPELRMLCFVYRCLAFPSVW